MNTLGSLNDDLFQKMELYTVNNTQIFLGGTCKTWANEIGTISRGDCGVSAWDKSYDGCANIVCLG
jgi:hypothetical protein